MAGHARQPAIEAAQSAGHNPRIPVVLLVLLSLAAPATAAPDAIPYRPGQWVEVPAGAAGDISAAGTATVVESPQAGPEYVLPMSAAWSGPPGRGAPEFAALPDAAWLVGELSSGPAPASVRDGVLAALPAGSRVMPLGDIRRGVPDIVDLIVSYDFGEARLQPQERSALRDFVRRGGALFFLFASRTAPSASAPLWLDLFGALGNGEKEAPGLPRGLLVPSDFAACFDEELPRLVWQRSGRGVVLAYGLGPQERFPERPDAAAGVVAAIVRRAAAVVRENRRPVRVGPIEPAVFQLFDSGGWRPEPRRALALAAFGYALAAAGLLVSFGGLLARRRWAWIAGLACIGAAGAGLLPLALGRPSGLALETIPMLIEEPGADPVEVVFARVTRLTAGAAPRLACPGPMPPVLVLHSRYAANQKTWVNYRFASSGPLVEPLLDSGQMLCLASVRPLDRDAAREAGAFLREAAPPENAGGCVALFKERWASPRFTYFFRWVVPAATPRLFQHSADSAFVHIHSQPLLLVRGTAPK